MIRIQDILDKVAQFQSDDDVELVKKAYVHAAAAHAGQMRLSGEPYFSHPLAVANILADMKMDGATVSSGLLHDTVEDTKTTIEFIDDHFGEDVADIVDGVTKISLLTFDSKEEQQAENIRKMLLAMNENIRVIFVKLADRLHNMRTLEFQRAEKQRRISKETMDIYAPLANRLGLYRIKSELEDLSFRYLEPDAYRNITDWLAKNRANDDEYIDIVISALNEVFTSHGIKAEITGRVKTTYGIYKKMKSLNVPIDELHDIIAFRALVDDIKDCYAALGLVHAKWQLVYGRFKDYISSPKGNGYQSLHTTVRGPNNRLMEVQIRTADMHDRAENGLASHWLYKEGTKISSKDAKEIKWLHDMLDWQKMETNPHEFMRTLQFDLFKDEIYVLTPQGAAIELPEGATPVDFAYSIHTEVGNHCAGAKVNGRLVPLSTALSSGQVVEIITDPNRNPSRDWLKFVKTAKARTRVQHYIRTKERDRSVALGREMLEKQGRRQGINFAKAVKENLISQIAKELNYGRVDDLLSAVGYARITPKKVLNLLKPKDETNVEPVAETAKTAQQQAPTRATSVQIRGVDDLLVQFAKCCNPVPGDPIIGYISRGRGLVVHNSSCSAVQNMEAERLVSVYWEGGEEGLPFVTRIRILAKNARGVLADIGTVLSEENVNIDSGNFKSTVEGRTDYEFLIEVTDLAHLYRALNRLRKIGENIIEVTRMTSQEMLH